MFSGSIPDHNPGIPAMKPFLRALIILSILWIFPPKTVLAEADSDETSWTVVGEGVEYRKFHLTNPRPIDLFVTRMDRSNLEVTIDTAIAQGRLSGGTETVPNMVIRYDQAINYWNKTWGNRNQVVAAINGYYFNTEENFGVPWSGQIHSGWYAKRFDDTVGDAGFAWTLERNAFIGDCVYHAASKQKISFANSDYMPNLQAINILRTSQDLILYTPQYDASTRTTSTSETPILEILIEMTRPTSVLPLPAKAVGYIRAIRDQQGSTQIPFDHVVLTAWGSVRDTLLSRIGLGQIKVGDRIGISQEIAVCPDSPLDDWSNTYAALGGDYHFLNDGFIRTEFSNPDAYIENSRTAVAYNASYIYFVVVDRWNPGVSEGITIPELANFVKYTLQATDAVTHDSGGSSTMVVNGQVVNNTTCNFNDCRTTGDLPSDSVAPHIGRLSPGLLWNQEENLYADQPLEDEPVIPYVANALMMVVVKEKRQSDNFQPGGVAFTDTEAAIRLGPGNNYARIGTTPDLEDGIFIDHDLNGVLAKGDYWWKVEFPQGTGWVREGDLWFGLPVLEADFKAVPSQGSAPLTVAFTNTSIGEYSTVLWEFGDGGTSTLDNPTYTYTFDGTYFPRLTITGPGGESQHQEEIRVTGDGYSTYLPLIVLRFNNDMDRVFLPLITR